MYMEDDGVRMLKKHASEANSVTEAWAKNGQFDADFQKVYQASITYLLSPPRTPLPFPRWLLQRHMSKVVEDRWLSPTVNLSPAPLRPERSAGRIFSHDACLEPAASS